MNSDTQDNTDVVEGYESPVVEDLGSIAEVTAGGTGTAADACNSASFNISQF
jgi:hypothetical protein